MYTTGEKINITQIEGQFPQAPFATREEREEFVKDWFQVPDEKFKEFILNWELRGDYSIPYYPGIDMTCSMVDWMEMMHYIDDALGVCAGLSSFPIKPPYHIHNFPAIVSSATGMDIDEDGLKEIARRNRNLLRAVNIRRGMRRADEKPPEDHWRRRFPELETELLNQYYMFKGWNDQGIPTEESLRELKLDDIAQDFLQRGILKEKKPAASRKTSPRTKKK
jgi:aldehyde:ferredoxin oxidoreductase